MTPCSTLWGRKVGIRGSIELYTKFGHEGAQHTNLKIKYVKMHAHTSYNILFNCPFLNVVGAMVTTPHSAMKFPSNIESIITIHAN